MMQTDAPGDGPDDTSCGTTGGGHDEARSGISTSAAREGEAAAPRGGAPPQPLRACPRSESEQTSYESRGVRACLQAPGAGSARGRGGGIRAHDALF
eukprot:733154-Alexandrium_andersonii.AAC.1